MCSVAVQKSTLLPFRDTTLLTPLHSRMDVNKELKDLQGGPVESVLSRKKDSPEVSAGHPCDCERAERQSGGKAPVSAIVTGLSEAEVVGGKAIDDGEASPRASTRSEPGTTQEACHAPQNTSGSLTPGKPAEVMTPSTSSQGLDGADLLTLSKMSLVKTLPGSPKDVCSPHRRKKSESGNTGSPRPVSPCPDDRRGVRTDCKGLSCAEVDNKLVTKSLRELKNGKGCSKDSGDVGKSELATIAAAVAAAKLGLADHLDSAIKTNKKSVSARDAEGRTCLHYAAGYGHEECVELLLSAHGDPKVKDINGDLPLHFAAIHGHPMCAYNISKSSPSTCLMKNARGLTAVDVAVACDRGEVLNAMLLACAGDGSPVAVKAMGRLLSQGAVPDTWAPNGSSALMLAAAADGVEALKALLDHGATIELQDALGRSALMFAAGNSALNALKALLDAGASLAARDRRGRGVLDYAAEHSEVRRMLEEHLKELEEVAARRQRDLLASLEGEGEGTKQAATHSTGADPGKKKSAKKKRKGCKNSQVTMEKVVKAERYAASRDVEGAGGAASPEIMAATPNIPQISSSMESVVGVGGQDGQLVVEKADKEHDQCEVPGPLTETLPKGGSRRSGSGGHTPRDSCQSLHSDGEGSDANEGNEWCHVGARGSRKNGRQGSPGRAATLIDGQPGAEIAQLVKAQVQKTPPVLVAKSHTAGNRLPPVPPVATVCREQGASQRARSLPRPTTTTTLGHYIAAADLSGRSRRQLSVKAVTANSQERGKPDGKGNLTAVEKIEGRTGFKDVLLGRQEVAAAADNRVNLETAGGMPEGMEGKACPEGRPAGCGTGKEKLMYLWGHQKEPRWGSSLCSSATAAPSYGCSTSSSPRTTTVRDDSYADSLFLDAVSVCPSQCPSDLTTCSADLTHGFEVLHAELDALKAEVAQLKDSNHELRTELKSQQSRHQQELAAVLEDAAHHELEAVDMAIKQERNRMVSQLLSFGVHPDVLLPILLSADNQTDSWASAPIDAVVDLQQGPPPLDILAGGFFGGLDMGLGLLHEERSPGGGKWSYEGPVAGLGSNGKKGANPTYDISCGVKVADMVSLPGDPLFGSPFACGGLRCMTPGIGEEAVEAQVKSLLDFLMDEKGLDLQSEYQNNMSSFVVPSRSDSMMRCCLDRTGKGGQQGLGCAIPREVSVEDLLPETL